MDQQQLLLLIELVEWAGLISNEQSQQTRRQINQSNCCSPDFCQNLLRQLPIDRAQTVILWQMVKIASKRIVQQTQQQSAEIAPEQLPPEWRKQIALAEQVLQCGLVSLSDINLVLEQLQTAPQGISLGQVLLRRRIITPQQLVHLQQQSLQQGNSMLYRIVKEPGMHSWQIAADDQVQKIGPYQIIREIARGGMGIVYEAVDPKLQRRVA